MTRKLLFFLPLLLVTIFAKAQNFPVINFKKLDKTHDIALSPWGPYTKRYAGISHLPDRTKGYRFDISVMPGYYRNKVLVPNVLFESGYFPWEISRDLQRITYRYELEWKDRVYVDATYSILDSSTVLIRMNCVNKTASPQNLALHVMASFEYPEVYPTDSVYLPSDCRWVNAISYKDMKFAKTRPTDQLVYDGWMRGEARNNDYIGSAALARDFGRDKGDVVTYSIPVTENQLLGKVSVRYRAKTNTSLVFKATGMINGNFECKGTGKFEMVTIPYKVEKAGLTELVLESMGGTSIELNGFCYGPENSMNKMKVVPVSKKFAPTVNYQAPNHYLTLKYEDAPPYYGIAWDYSLFQVREILNDELDVFFRKNVHNHVQTIINGNKNGHYTNLFMRPVELEPNSSKEVYALVCTGTEKFVKQTIGDFSKGKEIHSDKPQKSEDIQSDRILKEGIPYAFGNRLMQANTLSNIVYPIYTQQQYIRHFTPGKWWNSLYTWDSGFEALGLSDINPDFGLQCLNAYTTPAGSQSAFIHHGSMVPVQLYVFYDLWNKTQSVELLNYFYPRLKQYYEFVAGKAYSSTTKILSSNLLKTWDYFYNSGGWDDYPAQKAVHEQRLTSTVTPVITTAQIIRIAKMMRMAAEKSGLKNDIPQYDEDIAMFTKALQTYSWDEESGYFSYVTHSKEGKPVGFFTDSVSGKNFNMGLDGAYPLFAGICTQQQQDTLLNRMFGDNRMWTPYGLGVVDQHAPYYRIDGYWNGTVWMPHQWFMWKAMLDIGRTDLAFKIAKTALDVWKKETDESYYTFEHFFSKSGRGAGWHQFSGLSTPVLVWFSAYFKPGHVSTGFEIWINKQSFTSENTGYEADLSFDETTKPHPRSLIVCLNPDFDYEVYFNKERLNAQIPFKGLLQITLPATNKQGVLMIKRLKS